MDYVILYLILLIGIAMLVVLKRWRDTHSPMLNALNVGSYMRLLREVAKLLFLSAIVVVIISLFVQLLILYVATLKV